MNDNLSKIGVVELAETGSGSKLTERFPAYSRAAKEVKDRFKGNKEKLFLEEAVNCFYMYVTPLLLTLPPEIIAAWSARFGPPDNEKAWVLRALAELPALHNHIDIMVVVAPLAYATVFVSNDKGIRDMLRSRTRILSRTQCQYCDSLVALENWLTENVV